MFESDLPSPHIGGKSHHLRRVCAQAISYLEVNLVAGKHSSADDMVLFFQACIDRIAPYVSTYSPEVD